MKILSLISILIDFNSKMIYLVFIMCFILASIHAAPTIDNSFNFENVYRYDGAQLWRVTVDNDAAKELVFELQRKYGKFNFHTHT